jgi:hypothetical protein
MARLVRWQSYRYGANAKAAAEAEVTRQGFPAEVLARNVHFGEGAAGPALAVAIALGLAALAALNLAGTPAGRIGSWILQPLLLVAGGLIISRQVFTARFLGSAFKHSGDATLAAINVKAFVDAATGAYPPGSPTWSTRALCWRPWARCWSSSCWPRPRPTPTSAEQAGHKPARNLRVLPAQRREVRARGVRVLHRIGMADTEEPAEMARTRSYTAGW